MPSTYPPGATKACPQCGAVLRLGSFGGHMRHKHGTYGGISGIIRDDPRYRDRPRRVPNTSGSKNVPAGAYPNGSTTEPVEYVSSESMEAAGWEGPTDGKEPCPSCGRSYAVPYLYAHMREKHGIFGGRSGVKRMDKIQKQIAATRSVALVRSPEPERQLPVKRKRSFGVPENMEVITEYRPDEEGGDRFGIVEWQGD